MISIYNHNLYKTPVDKRHKKQNNVVTKQPRRVNAAVSNHLFYIRNSITNNWLALDIVNICDWFN